MKLKSFLEKFFDFFLGLIFYSGDPKMKFLRLFLSAIRRSLIRPTIKTSLNIAIVRRPTSDLGPIQWGQPYTVGPILYDVYSIIKKNIRRSFLWSDAPSVRGESDCEGHCRTADVGGLEVFTSF